MFENKKDPSINELVAWFQVNFPLLANDMKASNHNAAADEPNPYHIEDTIWTHAMMVCLRAENEGSNKIVKIAALLHDTGKPEARDLIPFEQKKPVHTESNEVRNVGMNDGKPSGMNTVIPNSGMKTHFRGHEGLSFYRSIEVVNKLEEEGVLNYTEKQEVLTIISLHGTLFDSIKDGQEVKPAKVIAKFGDKIQLYRDFVAQVKNDSTGRFFTSKDGRKNQALALGDTIFNDATFYSNMQRAVPKIGPKISILIGPPAVGKTTWRDKNADENTVIVSRDDIMMNYAKDNDFEIDCEHCKGKGMLTPPSHANVYEDYKCTRTGCVKGRRKNLTYSEIWKYLEEKDLHKEIDKIEQEIFKAAVRAKKNITIDRTSMPDIMVDRTSMSRKSRRKWLANVPKDYVKEAVIFATVYQDIYSRNKKRAEDTGKDIKPWIIGNMMRQFMVPMYDEVDIIKWVF